jgi:DNA polymerase III subunit alpha
MFCHLAVHSNYSLLEGISSPEELAQAASSAGMPALGLSDTHLLTGAVEFWLACKKTGIKPLIGLEARLATPEGTARMQLLASGPAGWSNLCALSSIAMLQDEESGPLSCEQLASNSADLIVLASGMGKGTAWLGRLWDIFGDRLYAALRVPVLAEAEAAYQLSQEATKLRVACAAVHPVYYLRPEQASLQRSVSAIRLITGVGSVPPEQLAPPASHFLNEAEMRSRYSGFHGALEMTLEIAQRCQAELPVGQAHYPVLELPDNLSASAYLRLRAETGAKKLYGQVTPEIQARLEHELQTIAARGYEPIFLIVDELLSYARAQGIPTASRGSASSSLVAHCLGITSPDPLALDLYFERFLNPARSKPPDIDTDICSRGRDRVIRHAFERFGAERVAMVATINRFRPKSALSDLAKAHGLPQDLIRELSNALPHSFWARRMEDGEPGEEPSPFAELAGSYPQLKGLFQEAETLLKLPRHLSVHPGGLVVSPGPMTERMAVMQSGSKGVTITQMDLESVEALGLVKIDLLGIRGLTVMGDVAAAIHSWRRSEFRGSLAVLENIPQEDPETSDRVEAGQTIGCFQIESPGMRGVLREIKARTVEDILVALALYRPGPLQGGLKDAFVRRFNGEEKIDHLHPSLEPLLEDTYGVILYQEQVLRIANQLAGFSLAEADLLRRAMSHFDPGKQMQVLREKFVHGAEENKGVPRETGERIWDLMAAFAGYGFPKAHAASYAVVGWRSAWCKTHYPAEFMAAVLANWGGYYSQRVYLSEARRMGLRVRPPNINHAMRQFSVAYPLGEAVLYMGMDQVRDLTGRTQERILRGRPFRSMDDFLARADPRRKDAENLVLAGALEDFGCIPALLQRVREGGWRAGQMSLFGLEGCGEEDWTLEQKVKAQEDVLGIGVDAHPLELAAERIARSGAISTPDALRMTGKRVRVAGIRQSSHRSSTTKGESMLFLTLEDLEGMLDVVIFPDVYRRVKNVISTSQPLIVSGTMEEDAERGEPLLRAERIDRI